MSDNSAAPRTVADILGILEAKRTTLIAEIKREEKELRGGGRPRGFQAEAATEVETRARGLAWLQGRVDAGFLLPPLRLWYQELQMLGIDNLPPWTGEPQNETATLDLLIRMIEACKLWRTHLQAPPPLSDEEQQRRHNREQFAELLILAKRKMKSNQLKLIEFVCERGGKCFVADLAPNLSYHGNYIGKLRALISRINKKLKGNYTITRHEGEDDLPYLTVEKISARK
jgi:hypothetical protein